MQPTTPDDLDERFESLPWEQVGTSEPPDRRWVYVAAAAVAVAAVVASATRTLWPAGPLTAPHEPPAATSTVVGATSAPIAAPEVETPLMSEADLRAVEPEAAERAVSAHAVWFVTEWLTVDGGPSDVAASLLPEGVDPPVVDAASRSFVESAFAISVEEHGAGSWAVEVLVRTLSAVGNGEHVRIPARVFRVTVGLGDDGPYVADIPAPGSLSTATAEPLDLVDDPAPDHVVSAAVAEMRRVGLPEESTLGSSRSGELWRISGIVRDRAGVATLVAVWIDKTGSPVPAPG